MEMLNLYDLKWLGPFYGHIDETTRTQLQTLSLHLAKPIFFYPKRSLIIIVYAEAY